MVRPSEQLTAMINGRLEPGPAFEFWCYRKYLQLRRMPREQANELFRQAPPHIKQEIKKWLTKNTGTTTSQRPRFR
jgi:hypothetical protein